MFQIQEHDEEQEATSHSSLPVSVKRQRRGKAVSKSDQILEVIGKKLQEPKNDDNSEHEALGRYIASRLNRMDNRTSLIAKKLLNDVIIEAELGNLNSSSRIYTQQPVVVPSPLPSDSSNYSGSSCSGTGGNYDPQTLTQYLGSYTPL